MLQEVVPLYRKPKNNLFYLRNCTYWKPIKRSCVSSSFLFSPNALPCGVSNQSQQQMRDEMGGQSDSHTHAYTQKHSERKNPPLCFCDAPGEGNMHENWSGLFAGNRRRHGKTCAAFGATACENLAAFGGWHTLAETVLVHSLAVVGLKCSFHCCISFLLYYSERNMSGVIYFPQKIMTTHNAATIRSAKLRTFFYTHNPCLK